MCHVRKKKLFDIYNLFIARLTLVATTQSSQPGQLAVSARWRSTAKTCPTPSVDQQVSGSAESTVKKCIIPVDKQTLRGVEALNTPAQTSNVDQQVGSEALSGPAQRPTLGVDKHFLFFYFFLVTRREKSGQCTV